MDITVSFAARAIDAVRSVAIAQILPRFRSVPATLKHDGSLVTEADLAAQEALVRKLTSAIASTSGGGWDGTNSGR